MGNKRYTPERTSTPGDFYVIQDECLACGVPHVVAPDLVEWVDDRESHCRWKKQPATPQEFEQAFAIFAGQEARCHRYAGDDVVIQERVGLEHCDNAVSGRRGYGANAGPFSAAFWKRLRR